MTKDELSKKVQEAINSLDTFTVTVSASQRGTEKELFSIVCQPVGETSEALAAEIEYKGDAFTLLMCAFMLHKAEEGAKTTAKQEIENAKGDAQQ